VFFSEALVKEGIEDGQRRQQEGKRARVVGLNWARGKVEEGDAQASAHVMKEKQRSCSSLGQQVKGHAG
jgi:hypothetical protein